MFKCFDQCSVIIQSVQAMKRLFTKDYNDRHMKRLFTIDDCYEPPPHPLPCVLPIIVYERHIAPMPSPPRARMRVQARKHVSHVLWALYPSRACAYYWNLLLKLKGDKYPSRAIPSKTECVLLEFSIEIERRRVPVQGGRAPLPT